ncbi:MAG: hypothetical protein ACRCT1_22660 [Microcoleaceae cyanobacterium]
MNKNTITQTKSLFELLREIQSDIERVQAKFAFLEENWEGFPDTFPVEYSHVLPEQENDDPEWMK